MNRETLINVRNISRYYGDVCAVDNISFVVARGEVLGILGQNGAGKSTAMQIICGVLAASSGSVSVAGYDITEDPNRAKQQLGFLPERPPLYTDLTVDEYLRYCARIRRLTKRSVNNALANSKLRCGLQDHGRRLINNLSKGYQQRVGIAQAIIHSPPVVVLDEPSSGLDPIQILEIRQLISELSKDHSVILSTHILPEVQNCCHRVLIINSGRLVLDESLQTLHSDSRQACCTVALQKPPLPEELEKIDGVLHVDTIDQYRFRVTYLRGQPVPQLLSESAASAGWRLFEMIPQYDSLEQTFLRLTRGELEHAIPQQVEP